MAQTPEERNAHNREYYWANRERIRAYQNEYRARNAEKVRAQQAEGYRRYRERNPERVRETARRYYQANREEVLERQRQQRRDPEYLRHAREVNARSREKNRDRLIAQRMFKAHGMWPEDWAAMWEAQDGRCYLCGEELSRDTWRETVVEHDHTCCPPNKSCPACRRGLACKKCNLIIGQAQDDPARLRRIADGLEAALLAVERRRTSTSQQQALFTA